MPFKRLTHNFFEAKSSRLILLAVLLVTIGCHKTEPLTSITGETMATTWSLQIADRITHAQSTEVRAIISHELHALETEISHWQDDSDLSAWNRSSSTEWQTVPDSMADLVALAQHIGGQTDGALEITAAPLIELWGFGPTRRRETLPSNEEIAQILKRVGAQHIHLNPNTQQLRKDLPEVTINVASVTEGYAMDRLIAMLKTKGIYNFLLEIGGEVAAIGHAPGGNPWQVGVQAPDEVKGKALEALPLTDLCIATSGSYRHRYEKNGRTYSHLIDPRTGKPVQHKLVSVSVIHPSCGLADGYATALMVLGPVEGRVVAARLGLRVIWLEEQ